MTVAHSNINKGTRNKGIIGSYLRDSSAFFKYLRLILKMPAQVSHHDSGGGQINSRKKKTALSRLIESSFLEEVLVHASHNEAVITQSGRRRYSRRDKTLEELLFASPLMPIKRSRMSGFVHSRGTGSSSGVPSTGAMARKTHNHKRFRQMRLA
jgi:hypothetical protein